MFVGLAYLMGFRGSAFSHIQVVLTYSFMAMLVHQFEEYAVPGGFPGIGNIAMFGEKECPERYPLNANQVMISNVFLTYPFYIIPILFPDIVWLGLAQVGQGMLQITNHGVWTNLKMKTVNNPGLASCIFLQWPIGVYYYIWFVHAHHLTTATDDAIGAVGAALSLLTFWIGPIPLLRDRQSRYPFSESEMFKYRKEQLLRMLQK